MTDLLNVALQEYKFREFREPRVPGDLQNQKLPSKPSGS
jgi:hypothetical protein